MLTQILERFKSFWCHLERYLKSQSEILERFYVPLKSPRRGFFSWSTLVVVLVQSLIYERFFLFSPFFFSQKSFPSWSPEKAFIFPWSQRSPTDSFLPSFLPPSLLPRTTKGEHQHNNMAIMELACRHHRQHHHHRAWEGMPEKIPMGNKQFSLITAGFFFSSSAFHRYLG